MPEVDFNYARMLAEILRIQRWAGGDSVPADRIFGLMHGFESVFREETESFGISEATQEKVEDLPEEVEAGTQSSSGTSIKERLRRDGIKESDAKRVMELCLLQSRFNEGIKKIAKGKGSIFRSLNQPRLPEQDWFGALHYMELIDCSEGVHKKMHGVFAPAVPRVGELVTPQQGSTMEVVGVEHVAIAQGDQEGIMQHCLIPHILLEAVDDDSQ